MLSKAAMAFGVVFVAVGALGFVPPLVPDGKLLGLFEVNTLHNMVHLATGVIAIVVGMSGDAASRMFFRLVGLIYALFAVLGFFYGEQPLLDLVANNNADTGLHIVIAAVALYLGFAMRPTTAVTSS